MANLFPRKVKERVGHAINRLEVLEAGSPQYGQSTPQPPVRRGGPSAPRSAAAQAYSVPDGRKAGDALPPVDSPAAAAAGGGESPRASPPRPVVLTTVRKQQPLRRQNRNLTRGRGGAGDRRDRDRKARDDGDPLEECVGATRDPDGFNHFMKQTLAAKKPKHERQDLAVRIVERMKVHRVLLNTETYDLLLKMLVDSGDDKCFRFYDQMKEDAEKREDGMVKPNVETYRTLIRACERTGEYKRAFTLFAEMKDHYGCNPDVGMYNTLMGFCVHTRDEEQAGNLFQEMKERRVPPNVHTYNCLMNVFAESPYDLLAQMYEDMLKQRVKPDLRTHNTLMRACQRVDDYDRCFKFFEDLKHEGIKPDVMTYNILLEMCRDRLDYVQGRKNAQSNRRTKEQQQSGMKAIAVLSLSLFNEMDERDVRPNTFTYNALMGVLARCADPRVFTVFCAMKEDQREEEEDGKRIEALIESGELADEEGMRMLAGINDAQGDMLLDDGSGAALRSHYQRLCIGEEDSARINAFGVKPNLETYQTLIQAAERMGKADAAYEVFEEMKARRVKPDKRTYIKMMDVCVLRDETERASELFREAKRRCILPDIEMYNAYMNVLAEAGDDQIFHTFDEVQNDYDHLNIKPNVLTYNTLIKACCKLRRPGAADERAGMDQERQRRVDFVDAQAGMKVKMTPEGCDPKKELYTGVIMRKEADRITVRWNDAAAGGPPLGSGVGRERAERAEWWDGGGGAHTLSLEEEEVDWGHHRAAEAFKLYDQMCEKSSPVKPNVETYNTLIDVCNITKDIGRARGLMHGMQARDMAPTITTYNRYLNVFVAADDDGIVDVFKMLKQGPHPNLESYTILLGFYQRRTDPAILTLFDDMRKNSRVDPDAAVYNIMLNYCAKIRDKRKSLKFFEELKVRELTADIDTYNALMAVFAESGDELIFKVFEEMIENQIAPDKNTFSTLIKHKKGLECLKRASEKSLLFGPDGQPPVPAVLA